MERLLAGADRAVLKLIVTRGAGGRGYRPPSLHMSSRILAMYPWPDYPASCREQGVKVRLCRIPLGRNSWLAGIKHLNRLEQVLARQEWDDPEISEGLMRDSDGNVVEGTMTNLFVVHEQRLMTSSLNACGVAGVMRGYLLDLARQEHMPIEECNISLARLYEADEVFLCNALIGIWPVNEVEGTAFKPGPVTRYLLQRLQRDLS
jgi:4-amino-4-deoxychorismate lyase